MENTGWSLSDLPFCKPQNGNDPVIGLVIKEHIWRQVEVVRQQMQSGVANPVTTDDAINRLLTIGLATLEIDREPSL